MTSDDQDTIELPPCPTGVRVDYNDNLESL